MIYAFLPFWACVRLMVREALREALRPAPKASAPCVVPCAYCAERRACRCSPEILSTLAAVARPR